VKEVEETKIGCDSETVKVAEKGFSRSQLYSPCSSSVDRAHCACTGNPRYTQGGERSFCKRSWTGKYASAGRESRFKLASADGSWRYRADLVFLRFGAQTGAGRWLDA
jgi:hypothetical protein